MTHHTRRALAEVTQQRREAGALEKDKDTLHWLTGSPRSYPDRYPSSSTVSIGFHRSSFCSYTSPLSEETKDALPNPSRACVVVHENKQSGESISSRKLNCTRQACRSLLGNRFGSTLIARCWSMALFAPRAPLPQAVQCREITQSLQSKRLFTPRPAGRSQGWLITFQICIETPSYEMKNLDHILISEHPERRLSRPYFWQVQKPLQISDTQKALRSEH